MNKLRLGLVLAIIAIVLLTTYGLKKDTPAPPVSPEIKAEVGYQAPDFTVRDLNGKTFKLSDFRGKPVYINFFATWCPPCKEEIPELQKFYEQNKNKMVFLAINITFNDKVADINTMIQQNNITYPIFLDEDQKGGPAALFEITGVPEHYFIDKNGVLRDKGIGPMTLEELDQGLKNASH